MDEILKAVITGTFTFTVTNIDDIFIITLFFAQGHSRKAIVVGQYLGFTALVLISLLGFVAGLVIAREYVGFLGLVPIALGVRSWLQGKSEGEIEETEKKEVEKASKISDGFVPSVLAVAAVTIANGGDNIGIYTPLFAGSSILSLLLILVVFYILIAVWCLVGNAISKHPHIAHTLTHYVHYIVPIVLIALGIFIMYESGTLRLLRMK